MNSSLQPENRLKHILFCTDFSESADAAFDFAIDAAVRRPGSTLHLLHVIHEPDAQFFKSYLYEVEDVDEQAKRAIDAKMAESYCARVPPGVPVKVDVRIGPDAATILQVAEEARIDLIVDPVELARRRAGFVPPPLPSRGWPRLHAEHVLPVSMGADLDFLTPEL